MVYHAVFDFFFCLETTGGSCSQQSFSLVSADAFGASSTYQLLSHSHAREQGVVTSIAHFGHSCCTLLPCHYRQCAI
jgi:hypothetical protein